MKKIKNLKLEEAIKICTNNKCKDCPLLIENSCALTNEKHFDKIKERKINV